VVPARKAWMTNSAWGVPASDDNPGTARPV
jgi:hypothetical protein